VPKSKDVDVAGINSSFSGGSRSSDAMLPEDAVHFVSVTVYADQDHEQGRTRKRAAVAVVTDW